MERCSLAVKSICSSSTGPKCGSQHSHGGSQLLVTPVRVNLMPFPGLCRHQACLHVTHRHMCMQVSTHTHDIKINLSLCKAQLPCRDYDFQKEFPNETPTSTSQTQLLNVPWPLVWATFCHLEHTLLWVADCDRCLDVRSVFW